MPSARLGEEVIDYDAHIGGKYRPEKRHAETGVLGRTAAATTVIVSFNEKFHKG